MKKYLYLSSLLFIVACGTTKMLAPGDADVMRGKDNFPGLTITQLHQGQQVYQEYCNKCHPYKKPGKRTAMEWKEIIPRMTEKVNLKFGNPIDAGKQEALFRYVAVMSTASK